MDDDIKFLKIAEPYGYMSNFYQCKQLVCNGIEYLTTEHLYQSLKFLGKPHEVTVRNARTAWAAAKLGRDPSQPMNPKWDDIRLDAMRYAVLEKFIQNEGLRKLLLSTGNRRIFEHAGHDKFWADGLDGTGLNWLGAILMDTRYMLYHLDLDKCRKHATSLMEYIRSESLI